MKGERNKDESNRNPRKKNKQTLKDYKIWKISANESD